MIEYLRGLIIELSPTHLVVEITGVAYYVNVSLSTYSAYKEGENALIYIHEIHREDAHLFYGFSSKIERTVFRALLLGKVPPPIWKTVELGI